MPVVQDATIQDPVGPTCETQVQQKLEPLEGGRMAELKVLAFVVVICIQNQWECQGWVERSLLDQSAQDVGCEAYTQNESVRVNVTAGAAYLRVGVWLF